MHDIPSRIADVLLQVEANLRVTGQWERHRPPPHALRSELPFCMDTLRFEQWLQWIFLPRMKAILEQRQPLPGKSDIHAYAEEALPRNSVPASKLLELVKRFDDLISIQAAAGHH